MKLAYFMKLTSFRKTDVTPEGPHRPWWLQPYPLIFYYCCEHCRTPCSYGPRNHFTKCGWAGCKQGVREAKRAA